MTAIDRALLNHGFPGSTWGNLGLWTQAQDYPAACEALAVKLAQGAQLQPGCRVLDVGFGYGDQLLFWKQRFGVGHVTGVEADAAGIEEARRKLAGYANVSLHLGQDCAGLPPAKYDRVLALDCAYHFDPRSDFLSYAMQSLRPGGVLALTDIVLADGAGSALHKRLAQVCGIPPRNLWTQTAYQLALIDLGFTTVRFEWLDGDVLSGFARFAARLLRARRMAALSPGGLKIMATATMAAALDRSKKVHYAVITAHKPS